MFESSIIKILVINAILHWHTIKDKRTQTVPNDPVKKNHIYVLPDLYQRHCMQSEKKRPYPQIVLGHLDSLMDKMSHPRSWKACGCSDLPCYYYASQVDCIVSAP